MKLLVVGGGGREHAIIKKLKQNPAVEKIYALPGNGGMEEAECVHIGAKEIPAIIEGEQGLFQKPDEKVRHSNRPL